MIPSDYNSWGRYQRLDHQVVKIGWRGATLPWPDGSKGDAASFIPFGNGRSYGDVCQNHRGTLLDCRGMDRFIDFDPETGVLRCEAGVLLADIHRLTVNQGWMLPVTPGTRFVTVGGAIANDVHGKNHHRAGSFGCHICYFELLRSDGSRLLCGRDSNPALFAATIGGLGLTGLITWAEIQLRRVESATIRSETIRYSTLGDFFQLAADSDQEWEYTVAWFDCTSGGRGLFTRGNHSADFAGSVGRRALFKPGVPFNLPFSLVNRMSLKVFNQLYYHKQRSERRKRSLHYLPFLYPLDGISHWNRIYGPRGFYQYQCLIPRAEMESAIAEIIQRVRRAGSGSFLSVLKLFGEKPSPGLLSFPGPGATLALDFPNQGEKTRNLLDQLDEVTRAAGGRLNPSKDARMTSADFRAGFGNWQKFSELIDPRFSSSFWRRVAAGE